MWKVFARLRRAKTFHMIKKMARLRAWPGYEATFEKHCPLFHGCANPVIYIILTVLSKALASILQFSQIVWIM